MTTLYLSVHLASIVPSSENTPLDSSASAVTSTTILTASSTEGYLPRKLYPGSYGEFCGPTPEVQVKQACALHGWHSDEPRDRVDAACEQHDLSYCQCQTSLRKRQRNPSSMEAASILPMASDETSELDEIPLLSSMTAVRFAVKPAMSKVIPLDKEYFDCIHKADQELIVRGISIRGEMQQSGCSVDPSLAWFCGVGQGTLESFEKVNLAIFLRSLDSDDQSVPKESTTLTQLEARRQKDLQEVLKAGKPLSEAASSDSVRADEIAMVRKLTSE